MDRIKKFLAYIISFIITFWTEKALAQPELGVSYYGNMVDLSAPAQEKAWYDFISRPFFYITLAPIFLAIGALAYLIIKRKKREKKHGLFKKNKK